MPRSTAPCHPVHCAAFARSAAILCRAACICCMLHSCVGNGCLWNDFEFKVGVHALSIKMIYLRI